MFTMKSFSFSSTMVPACQSDGSGSAGSSLSQVIICLCLFRKMPHFHRGNAAGGGIQVLPVTVLYMCGVLVLTVQPRRRITSLNNKETHAWSPWF